MGYRKLMVDAIEYGYIVGKKFVKIKGPFGSMVAPIHEVSGVDKFTYEAAQSDNYDYCGCDDIDGWPGAVVAITPDKVRRWIQHQYTEYVAAKMAGELDV